MFAMTSAPAAIASTLTPAALVCSLCTQSGDLHNFCNKCNRAMCEDCVCNCDHVTAEHALAAALQALWNEWPASNQTLLVQDEYGVCYATSGPVDCFLTKPEYEGEVAFKAELGELHERYQEFAAHTQDDKRFDTEHYSVTLKVFHIEGRVFTASVIHSIV